MVGRRLHESSVQCDRRGTDARDRSAYRGRRTPVAHRALRTQRDRQLQRRRVLDAHPSEQRCCAPVAVLLERGLEHREFAVAPEGERVNIEFAGEVRAGSVIFKNLQPSRSRGPCRSEHRPGIQPNGESLAGRRGEIDAPGVT